MRLSILFVLLTAAYSGYARQAPAAPQTGTASQPSGPIAAMQASVDKQKLAVKAQVGTGGPADGFFTTPWTTPASIPLPTLIPPCEAMPESDLKPLVAEAAKTQDVKPELVYAVVHRESAFFPCAISEKGALGLMQLMPEVAQQFGVDPLDPRQNVRAGTQYLKQLLGRYKGDLRLTLAAYNAGPERVDSEKKVPEISETKAYVDAIMKDLDANSAAGK